MENFRIALRVRRKREILNPEALAAEKALRGTFGYTHIVESSLTIARLFEFTVHVENEGATRDIAEKMLTDNFLCNSVMEIGDIASIEKIIH